jgi:hypothetical protein
MNDLQQKPQSNIGAVSNRVHIISRGNKWAVVKSKAKRASKILDYREQAFYYARQLSNNVIVHNKDGTVLFKHCC